MLRSFNRFKLNQAASSEVKANNKPATRVKNGILGLKFHKNTPAPSAPATPVQASPLLSFILLITDITSSFQTVAKAAETRPETVLITYSSIPGMALTSRAYLKAVDYLAKAEYADKLSRKRQRTSSLDAFGDSAYMYAGTTLSLFDFILFRSYSLLAHDLAIDNQYSNEIVTKAKAVVSLRSYSDASEKSLRDIEGGLRSEIAVVTHRLEYNLQIRDFLLAEHSKAVKAIESREGPPPLEEFKVVDNVMVIDD